MSIIISPSILNLDGDDLVNKIKIIENMGCKYLHIDVMDGKFVPNVSFTIEQIKKIVKLHSMVNDVHIMIEDPLENAEKYLDSGADILTFHLEACKNSKEVKELINLIHSKGKKVGISIKPKTEISSVFEYLDSIDQVLIMTVEPGLGGQEFIDDSYRKIRDLKQYIVSHNLKTLIEVDGGINNITGRLCKDAGVDILVAGTYLFKTDDIKERYESLL